MSSATDRLAAKVIDADALGTGNVILSLDDAYELLGKLGPIRTTVALPFGDDTCPGDPTHRRSAHDPGGAWFGIGVDHATPVETTEDEWLTEFSIRALESGHAFMPWATAAVEIRAALNHRARLHTEGKYPDELEAVKRRVHYIVEPMVPVTLAELDEIVRAQQEDIDQKRYRW